MRLTGIPQSLGEQMCLRSNAVRYDQRVGRRSWRQMVNSHTQRCHLFSMSKIGSYMYNRATVDRNMYILVDRGGWGSRLYSQTSSLFTVISRGLYERRFTTRLTASKATSADERRRKITPDLVSPGRRSEIDEILLRLYFFAELKSVLLLL